MEFAKIEVYKTSVKVVCAEPIPSGTIGATISVKYMDPIWDSYEKMVVFKGCVTKDIPNAGEVITIPAEVVAKPGRRLWVGFYGTDAEKNIAIPTFWAYLGEVRSAADPSGDTSTDPSLPVWAELLAKIKALEEQGIAVDMSTVEQAVREYLEANPPTPGLTEIPVATDKILGGIKVGENLNVADDGTLSVKTTGAVEETDLRPITSQAVYSEFGKIVALLNTI